MLGHCHVQAVHDTSPYQQGYGDLVKLWRIYDVGHKAFSW